MIGADGTYRGQDFLQWVFDAYRWILGSPKLVRMRCSDEQSTPIARMWFSNFLENDQVFLSNGATLGL